ncbi:Dna primase, large subunit [Cardiosporidium cionae]|uniref:Dna primase, large subunit n=1 Tax=Cardiosporidium cionae TaxID=476202 RepID=A0ABQ7JC53_9APIC|nr:Dna primase, large subunit [Cardiosporidium cionae]|eukprot:KAF8821592.1 Dna primase, large subunit [Cardiosporidium cionae]
MMRSHPQQIPPSKSACLGCFYGNLTFPISLYNSPPLEGSISLQDLEEAAVQRLEVLQYIHSIHGINDSFIGNLEEAASIKVMTMLKDRNLLYNTNTDEEKCKVASKDAISHFILKLAFSKDYDSQDWFMKQESRLLFIKLMRLHGVLAIDGVSLVDNFLMNEQIKYPVRKRYDKEYSKELEAIFTIISQFKGDPSLNQLYLVKFFPDACQLVRSREVYIKEGMAYVTAQDLTVIIITKFRHFLRETFAHLVEHRSLLNNTLFSDPRLNKMLTTLPLVIATGSDFKVSLLNQEYRLTPATIEQGAGFTLDETLYYNRTHWFEPEKFDKEFRYNVRHLYGQEGKRSDRAPYSCAKIMNGGIPNPGTGEFHGCPFKNMDAEPLNKFLVNNGMPPKAFSIISANVKSYQYQLACNELFKAKHHGSDGDGVGNHPNAYYLESRKYLANATK